MERPGVSVKLGWNIPDDAPVYNGCALRPAGRLGLPAKLSVRPAATITFQQVESGPQDKEGRIPCALSAAVGRPGRLVGHGVRFDPDAAKCAVGFGNAVGGEVDAGGATR